MKYLYFLFAIFLFTQCTPTKSLYETKAIVYRHGIQNYDSVQDLRDEAYAPRVNDKVFIKETQSIYYYDADNIAPDDGAGVILQGPYGWVAVKDAGLEIPDGENIYNADGAIPNGIERIVTLPDQGLTFMNSDEFGGSGGFVKFKSELNNPASEIEFGNTFGMPPSGIKAESSSLKIYNNNGDITIDPDMMNLNLKSGSNINIDASNGMNVISKGSISLNNFNGYEFQDFSGNIKYLSIEGSSPLTIKDRLNGIIIDSDVGLLDMSSHTGRNTFTDNSQYKSGLLLLGFGEAEATDTHADANYNHLVNTSLVPKRYVDDHIQQFKSEPPNPDNSQAVTWVSNGDGVGDSGDVMMKIKANGVTKTVTLIDFSAQ